MKRGDTKMDEIDWIPKKRVKELNLFKGEIFTHMKEIFDLLHNTDELEAFLSLLSDKEREELYDHPILYDSITNRKGFDLLP